jgi:hypothetical protein
MKQLDSSRAQSQKDTKPVKRRYLHPTPHDFEVLGVTPRYRFRIAEDIQEEDLISHIPSEEV